MGVLRLFIAMSALVFFNGCLGQPKLSQKNTPILTAPVPVPGSPRPSRPLALPPVINSWYTAQAPQVISGSSFALNDGTILEVISSGDVYLGQYAVGGRKYLASSQPFTLKLISWGRSASNWENSVGFTTEDRTYEQHYDSSEPDFNPVLRLLANPNDQTVITPGAVPRHLKFTALDHNRKTPPVRMPYLLRSEYVAILQALPPGNASALPLVGPNWFVSAAQQIYLDDIAPVFTQLYNTKGVMGPPAHNKAYAMVNLVKDFSYATESNISGGRVWVTEFGPILSSGLHINYGMSRAGEYMKILHTIFYDPAILFNERLRMFALLVQNHGVNHLAAVMMNDFPVGDEGGGHTAGAPELSMIAMTVMKAHPQILTEFQTRIPTRLSIETLFYQGFDGEIYYGRDSYYWYDQRMDCLFQWMTAFAYHYCTMSDGDPTTWMGDLGHGGAYHETINAFSLNSYVLTKLFPMIGNMMGHNMRVHRYWDRYWVTGAELVPPAVKPALIARMQAYVLAQNAMGNPIPMANVGIIINDLEGRNGFWGFDFANGGYQPMVDWMNANHPSGITR